MAGRRNVTTLDRAAPTFPAALDRLRLRVQHVMGKVRAGLDNLRAVLDCTHLYIQSPSSSRACAMRRSAQAGRARGGDWPLSAPATETTGL